MILVKRTYRITPQNDKFIKKMTKKSYKAGEGESAFIRSLLTRISGKKAK